MKQVSTVQNNAPMGCVGAYFPIFVATRDLNKKSHSIGGKDSSSLEYMCNFISHAT